MLPKSFLLVALLLGVTLLHSSIVRGDDEDADEFDEEEEEGNGRPRAPKTCVEEREAWMCMAGQVFSVCFMWYYRSILSEHSDHRQ